jgi:phosphonate transport system substrate-binding protein
MLLKMRLGNYCRRRLTHGFVVVILLGLVSFVSTLGNAYAAEKPAYRFGVFPYVIPARLEKLYAPVSVAFSEALGRQIKFRTAKNVGTFSRQLRQGEYDIALVQPFDVVPMVDERGYIGLARRPSHPAAFVTLANSSIQSINDIGNQPVGMPPNGAPASVFLIKTLEQMGFSKQDVNIVYFPNPLACLHKLLLGEVAVCGTGGGATQHVFEKKMRVKLITIMETESFPHMFFIAHPDIPERERNKLKQTILSWTDTEQGRALLGNIGQATRFVPFAIQDYDIVRQYRKAWLLDVQVAP